MSTRSNIARLEPGTGRVTFIYCHYDGMPERAGATLKAHYTTDAAVLELLALGNISALRKHVNAPEGSQHSYAKPHDDVTIAYVRDRGEGWADNQPQEFWTIKHWLTDSLANAGYDHLYLFQDGKWLHVDTEEVREKLAGFMQALPETK
jgi:hypothetical protein